MKRYRCTKPFPLDRIDDDGFHVWGEPMIIERGMEFTECENECQPDFPVICLENEDGLWINIHPFVLEDRFELVS